LQWKSFCLSLAKDCNEKPDPQGNAQIIHIIILKILLKANYSKPYAALNFALRIVVEILFEERKKIEAESLAEGNAQSLNKFLLILLKAKVSKTL
jgi:hypothetical protein